MAFKKCPENCDFRPKTATLIFWLKAHIFHQKLPKWTILKFSSGQNADSKKWFQDKIGYSRSKTLAKCRLFSLKMAKNDRNEAFWNFCDFWEIFSSNSTVYFATDSNYSIGLDCERTFSIALWWPRLSCLSGWSF